MDGLKAAEPISMQLLHSGKNVERNQGSIERIEHEKISSPIF